MTINSNTKSFSSLNGAIKVTQISQSESRFPFYVFHENLTINSSHFRHNNFIQL